ncbi:MAG: hypothetical protein QM696_03120 [Steroidobacteraceae bacterium]
MTARQLRADCASTALRDRRCSWDAEFHGHGFGQRARIRDQQRLRQHIVLSLRQQIRGDEGRIRCRIGDHQHFGRPGRQIAGRALGICRHQLLRSRGQRRAWTEDLVHLRYRSRAIGHGGHGLRATGLEHFVDAAAPCRHQHGRIGMAIGPQAACTARARDNRRSAPAPPS